MDPTSNEDDPPSKANSPDVEALHLAVATAMLEMATKLNKDNV